MAAPAVESSAFLKPILPRWVRHVFSTVPCRPGGPGFGTWRARRPATAVTVSASTTTGFHQSRMVATERVAEPLQRLQLSIRLAGSDAELQAAAWLRAQSFYAYPPERKFAGERHQLMIAEEEYASLKAIKLQQDQGTAPEGERSMCIVAVCRAAEVPGVSEQLLLPAEGVDHDSGSSSGSGSGSGPGADGSIDAVVGTLDLYAARALRGEYLIGNSSNAGYLANVCVSPAARRRRVGEEMLSLARAMARDLGVLDLFVHTLAVNASALRFYAKCGFVVEKEETSNEAHYRGRCLDGVEGMGRSVLLKDTLLRP